MDMIFCVGLVLESRYRIGTKLDPRSSAAKLSSPYFFAKHGKHAEYWTYGGSETSFGNGSSRRIQWRHRRVAHCSGSATRYCFLRSRSTLGSWSRACFFAHFEGFIYLLRARSVRIMCTGMIYFSYMISAKNMYTGLVLHPRRLGVCSSIALQRQTPRPMILIFRRVFSFSSTKLGGKDIELTFKF